MPEGGYVAQSSTLVMVSTTVPEHLWLVGAFAIELRLLMAFPLAMCVTVAVGVMIVQEAMSGQS